MSTRPTTFKVDEVIVLLGAGASVDAGIPHSAEMVNQIERELDNDWRDFKLLYNYVRSAIYYADGVQGKFGGDVAYNIERLVASLDELARREDHPLYPFIGAWNPRLNQVAGDAFCNVTEFKKRILEKLRRDWIEIDNYDAADYFRGLARFQAELNFSLKVFTLNYDLCVEKACIAEYGQLPERGFDEDRSWRHGRFESEEESSRLTLYKLHGSIDWTRDPKTGQLTYSDASGKIKADEGALIFGTSYKLQYVDPFLFLVYELRRLSLEARLIVVVGYGFADEHINGILRQALQRDAGKKLVAVTYFGEAPTDVAKLREQKFRKAVEAQLGLNEADAGRLEVVVARAKDFLGDLLTLEAMTRFFPQEESIFDEVAVEVPPPAEQGQVATG